MKGGVAVPLNYALMLQSYLACCLVVLVVSHAVGMSPDEASRDTVEAEPAVSAPFINVQGDFGAKGDGETDDSQAINDAIEHASKKGGGTVFLPHGTYRIESGIYVTQPDNVTIQGEGRGTRLDGRDLPESAIALRLEGTLDQGVARLEETKRIDVDVDHPTPDVSLQRTRQALRVSEPGAFNEGDLIEIETDEVFNPDSREGREGYLKTEIAVVRGVEDDLLILENMLYHTYDTEHYEVVINRMTPARNILLRDFSLELGGKESDHWGILINHFQDSLVENVEVVRAERGGIRLRKGVRGNVQHCHVKEVAYPITGYGIYFTQVYEGIIHANHGTRCRHSIEVGSGREIVISDNIVKNDMSHGISTHGGAEHITIIGNRIHASGGGIRVRGRNTSIVHNSIRDVVSAQGINAGETKPDSSRRGYAGHQLTVAYNTLENLHGMGMYLYNELKDAQIIGNRIINYAQVSEADAMTINGHAIHDTLIADNIIQGGEQSRDALRLGPPASVGEGEPTATLERLIIRNNQITSVNRHGIHLMTHNTEEGPLSEDILIEGNLINEAGSSGIYFSSGYYNRLIIAKNLGTSGGLFIDGYDGATPRMRPRIMDNQSESQ